MVPANTVKKLARRVFKKTKQPGGLSMRSLKSFRRPTAKLAMRHVHHLDLSIVGSELDPGGGAQTVYVLQVCGPAPA